MTKWPPESVVMADGADTLCESLRVRRMAEVADIMAEVMKLRDQMAAICNRDGTDASDVAVFYEAAKEWQWAQQKAGE